MKNEFEWSQECDYISRVTDKQGRVREMGYSRDTFIAYCEMQRECATRDGRHDSATYIQHCLDDLKDSRQWVVMVGAQFVVYPTQDDVTIIERKPVLGSIEQATRFTSRRRATETAAKTSAYSGVDAKALLVRDASIINHEAP